MSLSSYSRRAVSIWLAAVLHLSSIASTPDSLLLSRWGGDSLGLLRGRQVQIQRPLAFAAVPSLLKGSQSAQVSRCFERPLAPMVARRHECARIGPGSKTPMTGDDDQGIVSTVKESVQPKRGRGIGKNLVITPRAEREREGAHVDTKQSRAYIGKEQGRQPEKRRGRGIGKPQPQSEAVAAGIGEVSAFEAAEPSEVSIDEELEREWTEQVRRQGSIRPAGTRVRSRIGTAVPPDALAGIADQPRQQAQQQQQRGRGRLEGKQDMGPAIRRHKDLQLREMLRRTSIVTKGTNAKSSLQLFVNPGFLERRNVANERSAREDSRAGSVSLLDLKRLGLVDPAVSAQQIRRGSDAVVREIDVGMAIFDMQVAGDTVFSAGSDNDITVWNARTWEQVGAMKGHGGWVNALHVDEERGLLLSGSDDGTVRVWDLETLECRRVLEGHTKGALALSMHRGHLFVGCDGRIIVWDAPAELDKWELKTKLLNHTHVLRAMSDGQQLSKNRPLAPRAARAREPTKLYGHKVCGIQCLGPFLLTAVDDGSVWVWNTKNMEVERKLLGPSDNTWVRPLVIAELYDARRRKARTKLVSGWADGAIRIYDLRTWKLEHTLRAHNGPILSLSVMEGGTHFISTGADMAANIWDSESWTVKKALRSHKGAVCAACEVDGTIVTASLDGLIKIWSKQ